MKAKTEASNHQSKPKKNEGRKKASKKVLNAEPEQPISELSKEEIQKKINENWKLIDSSKDYKEYEEAWQQYDFYNNLKNKK